MSKIFTEVFCPVVSEKYDFILCNVGRIVNIKNIPLMLEAIKICKDNKLTSYLGIIKSEDSIFYAF